MNDGNTRNGRGMLRPFGRVPCKVAARSVHLPGVVVQTAADEVTHRDGIRGAFGVDRDHVVPAVAV